MKAIYEEIDLDNHAVIEASAGTGKTYTIEHLVVRILIEKQILIDEILLVTYTEKAAAELRDRIRALIEKECRAPHHPLEIRQLLENNLARLDQAPIQTIHAFCKNVLDRYPFEAGINMGVSPEQGGESLQRVWRRMLDLQQKEVVQCRRWIEEMDVGNLKKWFSSLFFSLPQIVEKYNPLTDSIASLAELQSIWERSAEEQLSEANQLDAQVTQLSDALCRDVEESQERLAEWVDPKIIKRFLSNTRGGKNTNAGLEELGAGIENLLGKEGGDRFQEEYAERLRLKEKAKQLSDAAKKLPASAEDLTVLSSGLKAIIDLVLSCNRQWIEEKEQSGEISFSDMIRLMRHAVEAPDGAMLRQLHGRFSYGIIDEFQDTNADQWAIFKKIFLDQSDPKEKQEEKEKNHVIYIVGDPKQSIYKFQGADVQTYLQAKNQILAAEGALWNLTQNFRSTVKMIDEANALFGMVDSGEDWFIAASSGLTADPVSSGKNLPFSGESGLQISEQRTKEEYARYIAHRIAHLHGGAKYDKEGRELSLEYSDFAVLVKSHSYARPVIRALRQLGIPVAKYKAAGIFSTDEALHWIVLLEAIDDPGERDSRLIKALSGYFFGSALDELRGLSRDDDPRNFFALFDAWSALAQARRWSDLLAHIWNATALEGRMRQQRDGEAILSKLSQLSDYTLQWMEHSSGGLREVTLHLRTLFNGTLRLSDDQDLQAKETEQKSVQVMTIHASKGLEFPVVFCMTALDNVRRSRDPFDLMMYSLEERKRKGEACRLLSLKKSFTEDRVSKQEEEEYRRLMYVAITRAGQLCDLPLWTTEKGNKTHFPCGHFALWLKERVEEPIRSFPQLSVEVGGVDERPLQVPPLSRYPALAPQSEENTLSGWKRRWWRQTSYTALVHRIGGDDEAERVRPVQPADLYTALPRSNTTGNALHDIFEHGDWKSLHSLDLEELEKNTFSSSEQVAAAELVEASLKRYGVILPERIALSRRQLIEALQMVQQTLRAQVSLDGCLLPIQLLDLSAEQRKHEANFFFSFDHSGALFPEERAEIAGFVKGAIDMLFSYTDDQGRWRMGVLDWKSNSLGDYSAGEPLDQAMQQNGYDKQALLYTVALDQHLRKSVANYDPSQNLAAPLYIFTRGCVEGESSGIWSPADAEEYRDISALRARARELLLTSSLSEILRGDPS